MDKKDVKNRYIQIRVNDEEMKWIEAKFKRSGYKSKSEFIRRMIFHGIIVKMDDKIMNNIKRSVFGAASNINQIAMRLNMQKSIYQADIDDLKKSVEKMMSDLLYFQIELKKLKLDD